MSSARPSSAITSPPSGVVKTPSAGRFREFMQCDFDTIGTRSVAADVETVLVVHDLLRAIGIERFTIHINNRMVLIGLLESLGLLEKSIAVLRAIDKLAKVGPQRVIEEIERQAGRAGRQGRAGRRTGQHPRHHAAVACSNGRAAPRQRAGPTRGRPLTELMAAVAAAGVPPERAQLDVSIARGLDYYTGTVLETTLADLPAIGSVSSGGRYDNLAELYTKQELPGIGASLGLDRLLAAMEELKMIEPIHTPAQVLITFFDPTRLADYLKLAAVLRTAALNVELYPEPVKLGKQLQYADRKGFRVALIAGEQEFAAGECQIKNLASGESTTASLANEAAAVIDEIRHLTK